jgi:hypothetical protein
MMREEGCIAFIFSQLNQADLVFYFPANLEADSSALISEIQQLTQKRREICFSVFSHVYVSICVYINTY